MHSRSVDILGGTTIGLAISGIALDYFAKKYGCTNCTTPIWSVMSILFAGALLYLNQTNKRKKVS